MRGNHHTFAEEKRAGKFRIDGRANGTARIAAPTDRNAPRSRRRGARPVRAGLSRLESAQAGMRSLAAAAAAQRPAAAIEFFDKLAPTPGAPLFGRGRVAGCARMSTRKSGDARARCGLARGRRTIGASRRTVGRKPRRAMTADMNEAGLVRWRACAVSSPSRPRFAHASGCVRPRGATPASRAARYGRGDGAPARVTRAAPRRAARRASRKRGSRRAARWCRTDRTAARPRRDRRRRCRVPTRRARSRGPAAP